MLTATNEAGIWEAARNGSPFTIRAEYVGYNDKNASGRSSKFWIIERSHRDGYIQIRYGRIGSQGRATNEGISIYDALERLHQKESKGYRVVSRVAEQAPAPAPVVNRPRAKTAPVVKDRAAAILEWASTLPAPFNTIRALTPEGVATDASGSLVCTLPQTEAARILGSL